MYRQYEDPYKVQKLLDNALEYYNRRAEEGADDDELFDLYNDVEDLRARLRFAWDDDEAAEFGLD